MTEPKEQEQRSSIERLTEELADTNHYLRYTFSFKMIILRGLITGVALVVGSTVVAGILFSLIQLLFGTLPFIPAN